MPIEFRDLGRGATTPSLQSWGNCLSRGAKEGGAVVSEGRGSCLPSPPPASRLAVQHGAHQQRLWRGWKLISNPAFEEAQRQTVSHRVGSRPLSFAGFLFRTQCEAQALQARAETLKASIHLTGPGMRASGQTSRGEGGRGEGAEPEKRNSAGTATGRGTDNPPDTGQAWYQEPKDLSPSTAWLLIG